MSPTLTNRRFWVCLLGVTGTILFAEAGLFVRMHRSAVQASSRWKSKLHERDEYKALSPAPTRENALRLETDLAGAQRALAEATAKLRMEEDDSAAGKTGGVLVTPTDTFFELAAFVARMRERAEGEGVALKPGERFGFSDYVEEPPAADLAVPVLRQKRLAETVLRMLFEARPVSLLSFQREAPPVASAEPPGARVSRASSSSAISGRAVQDYFIFDPQRSLRRKGMVESTAFRVVFTGMTGTLRSFLNALTTASLPLVVRSVEIERVGDESVSHALRRTDRAPSVVLNGDVPAANFTERAPIPVVVPTLSRYTIVIEAVNFVGRVPTESSNGRAVLG